MRVYTVALGVALAFATTTQAADLAGKVIKVTGGAHISRDVPLTLPFEGDAGDSVVDVLQSGTGKTFPATVRNGEFTFVPEGAMPGDTLTYQVEVEDRVPGVGFKVTVTPRGNEPIIDVLIDDEHFTSYYHSNDWKKPFLYPINSEDGVGITRSYPIEQTDQAKKEDHPHHKSLWTAYGEVSLVNKANEADNSPSPVDCWAEGENSGFQVSGEVTSGSGDAYGWIAANNTWVDKDKRPLIDESREYRFYATSPKGRLIDVMVTFTAKYGDVKFTDTKEGGIVAVRMRPELSGANAHITNALGDKGEETCWGKPSPWCDYSGELPGHGWRGLTVFDNPANLRYPSSWHVRNYGLMGANAFGYSYFLEKEYNKGLLPAENGDLIIKEGATQVFKYRVYVHSGDVEKAKVADRYTDYITPPKVSWEN
ncbi:MAG: PmoA family protein [Candidatus Hydrogenedentes bacterium]|nr:PmoA family protein [Candidatus Hydrogenedentota bacterium]